MNRLTISRNSWHYKLAQYGGLSEHYSETDLCRYWWALVRGVLRAPFLAALGAFLLFVVIVDPLLAVAVFFATGQWVLPYMAPLSFAVYLVGAWICIVVYRKQSLERRPNSPPGLVRSAYHGFKEKICVLVQVD